MHALYISSHCGYMWSKSLTHVCLYDPSQNLRWLYLGVVGDLVNELFCEVRGVGVQDADPVQALQLAQLMHQLSQAVAVLPTMTQCSSTAQLLG